MQKKLSNKLSLVSHGAYYQIRIATILMGVLPLLVLCVLMLPFIFPAGIHALVAKLVICSCTLMLSVSGYAILRKFPQNIIKLRQYLRDIAEGELPDKITLENTEDDIASIENYMNLVLSGLRSKVDLLEKQLELTRAMKSALIVQQQDLLEAEQQRVMIQSLGAACHHIGQPATLLGTHLYLLKNQSPVPAELVEIEECERAMAEIIKVLDKLRLVGTYRTMPYRTFVTGETQRADEAILDIEADLGLVLSPPEQSPILLKARILVIDDEEQIRSVLHKLLSQAGYEVMLAEDGQQGLNCCHQQPVDLVITDIVMPGKEGLGTIRELRRDFPDLKIIAISGGGIAAGQDYLKIAKQFGAQRIFEKPVELSVLLKDVKELLTQSLSEHATNG
ncbi:MAG: response regulator [Kiritimatiellae bacterium]|jgi:CheY-like chemotaxis protein|nr:response regulator [Kiritimatiellia bacterium]